LQVQKATLGSTGRCPEARSVLHAWIVWPAPGSKSKKGEEQEQEGRTKQRQEQNKTAGFLKVQKATFGSTDRWPEARSERGESAVFEPWQLDISRLGGWTWIGWPAPGSHSVLHGPAVGVQQSRRFRAVASRRVLSSPQERGGVAPAADPANSSMVLRI